MASGQKYLILTKSEQSTSIATTPGLDKFLVAAVGVQYETRRRTKFLGYIQSAKRTGDLDYEFQAHVNEADGYAQVEFAITSTRLTKLQGLPQVYQRQTGYSPGITPPCRTLELES